MRINVSWHPKAGCAPRILLLPVLLMGLQRAASGAETPVDSRAAAITALNRCLSSRQPMACLEADTALQELLQQQGALQRQQQPRCLPALTRVETYLAAYRWGLETTTNLQRVVAEAQQQCPEP